MTKGRPRPGMTDHQGMTMYRADLVRDLLEPMLSDDMEVTSVPWSDEAGEWIVTVWDRDGVAVVDIFERNQAFTLRRIGGRRTIVGLDVTLDAVPDLVAQVVTG